MKKGEAINPAIHPTVPNLVQAARRVAQLVLNIALYYTIP